MPDGNNGTDNHEQHHHDGARLTFRVLIPIVLLGGGLFLLSIRIAGWSIIFGLPMVTFGVVFLIYTYDELVTNVVRPIPQKTVSCSVCGKPTTKLYPWQKDEDAICLSCREDIAKGIKMHYKTKTAN